MNTHLHASAKSLTEGFKVMERSAQNYPFSAEFGALCSRVGFMPVSANFAIAGMLTYYSWAPMLAATKGRISFIKYAIVRYVRTLPVIIFTLLLVFVFPAKLGSGPVFRTTLNTITNNAIENGWSELVALSNFFNVDKIVSFILETIYKCINLMYISGPTSSMVRVS